MPLEPSYVSEERSQLVVYLDEASKQFAEDRLAPGTLIVQHSVPKNNKRENTYTAGRGFHVHLNKAHYTWKSVLVVRVEHYSLTYSRVIVISNEGLDWGYLIDFHSFGNSYISIAPGGKRV